MCSYRGGLPIHTVPENGAPTSNHLPPPLAKLKASANTPLPLPALTCLTLTLASAAKLLVTLWTIYSSVYDVVTKARNYIWDWMTSVSLT